MRTKGDDHQLKKLLIVRQILLVSTLLNVQKIVISLCNWSKNSPDLSNQSDSNPKDKGCQPSASADNPNLDLDYSGYHKNPIQ